MDGSLRGTLIASLSDIFQGRNLAVNNESRFSRFLSHHFLRRRLATLATESHAIQRQAPEVISQ